MTSRILATLICFALVVPVSPADEKTAPSSAQSDTVVTSEKAGTAANQTTETDIPPGQLSEDEESSLSARSQEPGPEVAGGSLSNQHLTYAVIALAAIVLVLLIK